MSRTVEIPASIEEAKPVLNGLGRLLTATEWERAAIVAAFVEKGDPKTGRSNPRGNPRVSYAAFAKLGIIGLRDDHTVARYETAWREHSGFRKPRPGQTVELPTKAFPSEAAGTAPASGGRPRTSAGEIRDAVARGDKRVIAEVTEGLAASEDARDEVVKAIPGKMLDAVAKDAGRTRNHAPSNRAKLDEIFGPFVRLNKAVADLQRTLPDYVPGDDIRDEALETANALEATAEVIRSWVRGTDVAGEVEAFLKEVTG